MLKKRILAFILAVFVLVLPVAGCGQMTGKGKPGSKESAFRENFGDGESRKALEICLDMGKYSNQVSDAYGMIEEFIDEVKDATGMDKVSVLFLPGEGTERESLLDSLRVEIMAGGGPDLFLLRGAGTPSNYTSVLVNFPEKAMKNGLFLPLDEYMENNTRFTDWSKQTKVILDAGKNEEGQLIIPLAYTLPLVVYPKDEVKLQSSSDLTMQDILNDPETAELGAVMYNGLGKIDEQTSSYAIHEDRLAPILGTLADFDNEELLFTEEDLMRTMDTVFSLRDAADENQQNYIEENLGVGLCYEFNLAYFDEEMEMIPLYSRNGGVTATITAYAAVNRNTNYPEEAFTVIDLLMREKAQQESELYYTCFMPWDGFPLQDDLGREEKPLLAHSDPLRYLEKPYYEDLQAIKEQITEVTFRDEFNLVLETTIGRFYRKTYDRAVVSEAYEKMERMIGE
ncbi:MAG: extracellular solute-binding protein [Clostridia bacterium]|nr:extracellular solute-binding protein [Clostridia bacterium]